MTHGKASHSPSTERSRSNNEEDAMEAENDDATEKYRYQWSTPWREEGTQSGTALSAGGGGASSVTV